MKKLIAFMAGSMFFMAAQACNWDRQDCSDQILGEAVPNGRRQLAWPVGDN